MPRVPDTGSPMWPPSEHAPDLIFPLAYHRSRESALQPTVLHRQRAPVKADWLGLGCRVPMVGPGWPATSNTSMRAHTDSLRSRRLVALSNCRLRLTTAGVRASSWAASQ